MVKVITAHPGMDIFTGDTTYFHYSVFLAKILCVLGIQDRRNPGPGATQQGSLLPDQGGAVGPGSRELTQARARCQASHVFHHQLSATPNPKGSLLLNLPSQGPGAGSHWTDGGRYSSLTQSSGLEDTLP